MTQWNYADLLDALGMESWQFMILSIVVLLLWSFGWLVWKLRGVGKSDVQQMDLPAFHAVYISFQDSYDHFNTIFEQAN